jgi:hypothetical protein
LQEFVAKTKRVAGAVVVELPIELLKSEQISADMTVKVTVQKLERKAALKGKIDQTLGPDDPWKLLE